MEISLGSIITVVLLVLKLTGKIAISWVWVFAPALINFALLMFFFFIILVMKLAAE